MVMSADVIPAKQLPSEWILRWEAIQESNPSLASPYFRPEFTLAVSRHRNDAFVALTGDGAAFLPFQRMGYGIGQPIGGGISDYHGLIAPSDYRCDVAGLVRACRLLTWDFDHVPAEQGSFSRWQTAAYASPVVDLRSEAGARGLPESHLRGVRKLEREFGPVEVELDSADPAMLELCLQWKSDQYRRTGVYDLFAHGWVRALAIDLAATRGTAFAGMVSVLRAGGRPIAAHFGLRSRGVLHYWFPAYDTAFARFSPGLLLLSHLIAHMGERGIDTIDLGRGAEPYKLRLATRAVPLMEGSVAADRSVAALRRAGTHLMGWARRYGMQNLVPAHGREIIRRIMGGSVSGVLWFELLVYSPPGSFPVLAF